MLRFSAQSFAECMLDEDDVDVPRFIAACRGYVDVLHRLGPFTMISIREVQSNMVKEETAFGVDPQRLVSMRALLEEEVKSHTHSPGGVLADPSAAMGLLWARRGLAFWLSLFTPHVDEYLRGRPGGDPPSPSLDGKSSSPGTVLAPHAADGDGDGPRVESPTGKRRTPAAVLCGVTAKAGGGLSPATVAPGASAAEPGLLGGLTGGLGAGLGNMLPSGVVSQKGYEECMRAYEETIGPFNGWIGRNTFNLGARATPDWEAIGAKLAPTRDEFHDDADVWCAAVTAVLERMAKMQRELDLEDQRKTI